MKAAKGVTEEIKSLLLREEYSKALKVVEERAVKVVGDSSSSLINEELLLLISKTYYFNKRYEESKDYLAGFESRYSDSTGRVDYIIQKFKLLISENKAVEAIELLDKFLKNERPEKEYYELNFHLGQAHFWNGDYFEANHLLEKCYRYYLINSDNYMLGMTLYMFGYIAFQRGSLDDAESYFNKALRDFKISEMSHKIGNTYKMLSIVNYRSGRYEAAKETIDLSEGYFRKCSSKSNILNCRIVRARIAMFEGNYQEAEEFLLGTYEEAGKINFKRVRALSAEFLGELYYRGGGYEKALFYLKEAYKIALDTAPRGDIAAEVSRRLGDLYIALEEKEEAEEMLVKAETLCRHLGDKYELGCVYRAKALLAIGKQDIDLARSYFKESIFTLRSLNESFELATTYASAAGEYMLWGTRAGIREKLKRELLEDAVSFAADSEYIFSDIELPEMARRSRRLLEGIEKVTGKRSQAPSTEKIKFNPKWLKGDFLVARSKEMKDAAFKMKKAAVSGVPVLIAGETGTGKEVAARFIHKMSDRATEPFVTVNCAALHDGIFESELFGHKRGAFTGAFEDRVGLIEKANGGTLFLDEITELSGEQQAKLLRVLEERKIRRLGESSWRPVNIRLISATNRPAEGLIASGEIRRDLYSRIAADLIVLKPLRERRKDIRALFAYYLGGNGNGHAIEPEALNLLKEYHWPGNVRELVNLTKSMEGYAGKRAIRVGDFPHTIRHSLFSESRAYNNGGNGTGEIKGVEVEKRRELILSVLKNNSGNKAAAARELGISRNTIYRYLKKD